MGAHINEDGLFQSDRYPTCPPGKVPLSVRDPMAADLLWEYAQRRRPVDAEFSADLETALRAAGYAPKKYLSGAEFLSRVRGCVEPMTDEQVHAIASGFEDPSDELAALRERVVKLEALREAVVAYLDAVRARIIAQNRWQQASDRFSDMYPKRRTQEHCPVGDELDAAGEALTEMISKVPLALERVKDALAATEKGGG